jgi:D-mannonate dehydratase
MDNKELFKREYMCEWVHDSHKEDLVSLLTERYQHNPIINSIISYIRQEYWGREHQPYRPSMKNLIENNLYEICYQVIKILDEERTHMINRLENETTNKVSYRWDELK